MENIVVLFEVKPTKAGMQKYLDLAAMLKPMLSGFEGFIRAERFSSLNEEGKLLSMNVWTDEAAVERWRNVMQHRMSQKEGRVWMEQLKQVLETNIELAINFFQNEVQGVSLRKPEGTYLVVPDFENWCKSHDRTLDELRRRLKDYVL